MPVLFLNSPASPKTHNNIKNNNVFFGFDAFKKQSISFISH